MRKGVFGWLKVTFCKTVRRRIKKMVKKMGQFLGTHISRTTGLISSYLVCRVAYMEGIKYMIYGRNWPSGSRDTRG